LPQPSSARFEPAIACPSKSALLRAVLKGRFEQVASAVERVCQEQHGSSLNQMVAALVTTFLAAKMKHVKTSVAFYSASSDLDGMKIARPMSAALNKAILEMLVFVRDPLAKDAPLVPALLQRAMASVSRPLLESAALEK
jgi:hypothetical protein